MFESLKKSLLPENLQIHMTLLRISCVSFSYVSFCYSYRVIKPFLMVLLVHSLDFNWEKCRRSLVTICVKMNS